MQQIGIGSTHPTRRDGWTHARRAGFLDCLTATANVKLACAVVGLSRQSAYRLQARDRAFAAGWDDALREAREAVDRAFIAALPESLRRILLDSSTPCHLRPQSPRGCAIPDIPALYPVTVVNTVSPSRGCPD
ncbi:MAG TPA: hypothetical protein VI168_15695 [Croceibacterium sp.]